MSSFSPGEKPRARLRARSPLCLVESRLEIFSTLDVEFLAKECDGLLGCALLRYRANQFYYLHLARQFNNIMTYNNPNDPSDSLRLEIRRDAFGVGT